MPEIRFVQKKASNPAKNSIVDLLRRLGRRGGREPRGLVPRAHLLPVQEEGEEAVVELV